MNLEILTPDKTVFSGAIRSVTVPGTKGPFTILKNHAPIISTLESGEVCVVTSQGSDMVYIINQGMIEVNKKNIMVLAEKIRPAEL
ncbi:MAG: ATP synthase F1 subunit epsilon [Bacteroidales bacterium]